MDLIFSYCAVSNIWYVKNTYIRILYIKVNIPIVCPLQVFIWTFWWETWMYLQVFSNLERLTDSVRSFPVKQKMNHWNENNYSIEMSSLCLGSCHNHVFCLWKHLFPFNFPGSRSSLSNSSSLGPSPTCWPLPLLVHSLSTPLPAPQKLGTLWLSLKLTSPHGML